MSAQKSKQLVIKPEWCKGCGICISFCPKNVLALNEKDKIEIKNIEDCTKCGLCELRCPDYAIYLKEDK
ncbi:4Fe-4S binding protein [Clostridiaceae bacterium M8S5]|nr:4Fe-4S binding protein [Clostridiaceae bacterium M8S5]